MIAITWFKVDDHFWSHPKVLRTSSLALGVWVRVGSYCSSHLTDGLISDQTVYTICPESARVVDKAIVELEAVGLWEVADGPHPAHRFHDWASSNPSRDQVEARREAEREKKRKQRRNNAGQFTVIEGGGP